MNVLQVNGYESPGKRFNGIVLGGYLKDYGIKSKHIIWYKDTNDPEVLEFGGNFTKTINKCIRNIESALSLQSILYPHSLQLLLKKEFRKANLIHYHIIHSGYFSLLTLPLLTRLKPSVWTLHDPWALTGHCIQPLACEKWKIGCGSCPSLHTEIPLRKDNTALLFNLKRYLYKHSKIDLIVASEQMLNMVKQSPLFLQHRVHHIPFGIDLELFQPSDALVAKEKLGINQEALVLCFRSDINEFKGLKFIIEALHRLKIDVPICLLTFAQSGLLEEFRGRYQIVELDWIHDEVLIKDAFNACDIFLMPSVGEAFGVMAIEAMACGKPVIVFEGTALPKIVFANDVGIAVPMKDAAMLSQAIERLINNPQERFERGRKARKMTEQHYDIKLQAKRMAALYHDLGKKQS